MAILNKDPQKNWMVHWFNIKWPFVLLLQKRELFACYILSGIKMKILNKLYAIAYKNTIDSNGNIMINFASLNK
ncbi:hypothetical protein SAMN05661044_00169 [Olivibacter domesticus]|uniref:Uncharacterized protein n=1 Tax=Olivibacter domesticus TaxID=407022 RepID=A0A1H7GVS1_OLID1|nr:hypothetical protein SAMN05661044_00169 [Olivibacter domesticus]